MSKNKLCIALAIVFVWGAALALAPVAAQAAPPVVKTVPWVPSNPLVPHDTYAGKAVTLKGTCDQPPSGGYEYSWDFGDGTSTAFANVTNKYVIEAKHTFAGVANTVFTTRLTVRNKTTGETGSKEYYVALRDKTLSVEVNVAIDEGIWFLHKAQYRYNSGGVDYGIWDRDVGYGPYVALSYYGIDAANVNAFEVNGHLENGNPDNPYVETVARGMRQIFTFLYATGIGVQPKGDPDSNLNGLGVSVNQGNPMYQLGFLMDAIVASGTPNAVASTGTTNIVGRTYKDIVQDMVDYYAWAQYDSTPPAGGWRYNPNEWPDNSVCQWAAIGMIAAEKSFGCTVPQWVKDWNKVWLQYSQNANGGFGYTDTNPVWGWWATTPSGMVQMVLDGIGRTTPGSPSWNKAETFVRDNFGNTGGAGNAIKDYYYGLFSFVKSMLLHNTDGVPGSDPITLLQSQTPGVAPIDWYAAEASKGAPTDGVARTLVGDQDPGGFWWGHNQDGNQYRFETAWAIIMLNRTLFDAGSPVAVAKAIPNPGVAGQTITLDGASSYHQDAGKSIVQWEWDINNDGTFDKTGPVVSTSFAATGDYPVKLRVTDNSVPPKTAETIVTGKITTPPIAPTADAGGPYVFCLNGDPLFLDATKSINPDEGQSEPGKPGDTIFGNITQFAWDLNGDGQFDDAFGAVVDVTAYFTNKGPGSYLVSLQVTDTTLASFPSSGMDNLSSTSTAEVRVYSATDPNSPCVKCVKDLSARAKLNKIQLTWKSTGADSYNIYRGTVSGGPYVKIANTPSTYCTYLDTFALSVGTTYYYVVRPVLLNSDELCQSNQASAKPTAR
jgi:hypothetical protein